MFEQEHAQVQVLKHTGMCKAQPACEQELEQCSAVGVSQGQQLTGSHRYKCLQCVSCHRGEGASCLGNKDCAGALPAGAGCAGF